MREFVKDPLAAALRELALSPVGEILPLAEHCVDRSGQFVGGCNGFGPVYAQAQ